MLACLDLGSRTLVAVERGPVRSRVGRQSAALARASAPGPYPEKWTESAEERASPKMTARDLAACELSAVCGGDHAIATSRVSGWRPRRRAALFYEGEYQGLANR
jgi:hypothetical protein